MPNVKECAPVFQTSIIRVWWRTDDEWVKLRVTALSLVFSPVMLSAVEDEHGEAETWSAGSWDPSGSQAGDKRRALERSLQWMFKMSIQGTGTTTQSVDGSVGGEATDGARQAQERFLVFSGCWKIWMCTHLNVQDQSLQPFRYNFEKDGVYVEGLFFSNPDNFSLENYKTIPKRCLKSGYIDYILCSLFPC